MMFLQIKRRRQCRIILCFTLWMIFDGSCCNRTVLVDGYSYSNSNNYNRMLFIQHKLLTSSSIMKNQKLIFGSIISQNIDTSASRKSRTLLKSEMRSSSSMFLSPIVSKTRNNDYDRKNKSTKTNNTRRKQRIFFERYQSVLLAGENDDSFANEAQTVGTPTTTQQQLTTKTTSRTTTTFRTIRRLEKFTRLPVWPVWSGVLIWIIEKLLGPEIGSKLEHQWTGRVCPNFYNYIETDPFIMLVHHCHSFYVWDLVRYIQRQLILPEGFPSHPHRGFITLTYIMHGGFVHRDSMGIQQKYGGSLDNNNSNRYNEKHTQWLHTGSGLLHEEMFDIQHLSTIVTNSEGPKPVDLFQKFFSPNRQELYQIWLNVPSYNKMIEPYSMLLGGNDETPIVIQYYDADVDLDHDDNRQHTNNNIKKREQSRTIVLAGTYNEHLSKMTVSTTGINIALFHVQLKAGATWDYKNIPSTYETLFIYVRCGLSLRVLSTTTTTTTTTAAAAANDHHDADSQTIPVHTTAYLTSIGTQLSVVASDGDGDMDSFCDFLVLAGQRIDEPCVAAGSMVMTTSNEIQKAYQDYQNGIFGIPWDYKLTDEQWMDHVAKSSSKTNLNVEK